MPNVPTSSTPFAFGNFGWMPSAAWLDGDLLGLGKGDPTAGIIPGVGGAGASQALSPPSGAPADILGALTGDASHWFVRGVVIILGFIFVAVGLSMFRNPAIAVTKP